MAWFGSLQTASQITIILFVLIVTTLSVAAIRVFYNHRKYQNRAGRDLEAVREEVAQHIRSGRRISNWDRFGFRITDSSFCGGTFESRTNSLPEPRSPSDSVSKKSMRSQMSQRLNQRSITRSMISAPVGTGHTSPLNQNPITKEEMNRFLITRAAPQPKGRRLRVSDVEPFKLQPSSPISDIGTASSTPSSPTSLSPEKQIVYQSYEASVEKGCPLEFQAPLRLVLPAPLTISHNKTKSNPIIRKPLPSYSRPLSHQAQPATNSVSEPSYPSQFHRGERSFLSGTTGDRPSMGRTFSTIEPSSVLLDRSCGVSAPRKPPRVLSACGSWGEAIFKEINDSLAADRLATYRPATPIYNSQGSSRRTSTSSSVYSIDSDPISAVDGPSDSQNPSKPHSSPSSPPKSHNDPSPLEDRSYFPPLPPTPTSISSQVRKSLSIHSLSFPSPPLNSTTLAVPPCDTESTRVPSADFSTFYESYHH